MIYLDNNATTRPCEPAVRAAHEMLTERWHNPSSAHRPGQAARANIELARRSLASLIGAKGREIVFTSGGTEAVHLALRGTLATMPPDRRTVVTTPIEHEAIRDLLSSLSKGPDGIEVRELPIDGQGFVSPESLDRMIDESVAFVTLQWANNETGVIQPMADLARIAHDRGVRFHTDATQAVGKIPVDLANEHPHIDLLTLSAHKFHGAKGAGALFVRESVRLAPLFQGSQEQARRAGTENAAGIAAMGAAADEAQRWLEQPSGRERIGRLRDRLESSLLDEFPDAIRLSPRANADRLWNTTNIAFPGVRAELLVMSLAEAGVCASAGSACASGAMESSPVVEAMQLPDGTPDDIAFSSVRFSLSRETTEDEIEQAIGIITRCVRSLSGSSA